MFTGAINADVRAMLAEVAPQWAGRAVYVGCSGNFTVERILADVGIAKIHGCDVSLYSCALGTTLAGHPMTVTVKDERFAWMAPYLTPGLDTVVTLLMSLEYLRFVDRDEPYHARMRALYEDRWETLHSQSLKKVEKLVEGVVLASYTPGDVLDFVAAVPEDGVVVTFPPTYASGYEKLYAKLDDTFAWDAPDYPTFDDDRFALLMQALTEKAGWMTMRDHEVPLLADHLVGKAQTTAGAKPVFVYASRDGCRLTTVQQKVEPVPMPRAEGPLTGDLALVRLTGGQLNHLRSQYLSVGITPAGAQVVLGVTVGGQLIGVLAFSTSMYSGQFSDAYMMTDLAVAPTPYKRLSKLVLAVACSTEVRDVLVQSFNTRIRVIGTTAFTKKATSMKYRGLFEQYSKKDDAINYVAHAGRWSMAEGYEWWKQRHSQQR